MPVAAAWGVSVALRAEVRILKGPPSAVMVDGGPDVGYTHCIGVVNG